MNQKMAGKKKKLISRGLREALNKRRLTAYATAKKAEVSVDAVQRFLKEERGLSFGAVDEIADALDLSICDDGTSLVVG